MLRPPRAPAPRGVCERVARAAYGWREEAPFGLLAALASPCRKGDQPWLTKSDDEPGCCGESPISLCDRH